ncbi:hypothetical protein B296_00039829 [Ensete ventricosum]|nr:hypothetical protein B296_00039829 [Ensete ventricosum]
MASSKDRDGEMKAKVKERETEVGVAVFCPSPDVNNKAALFIARCHANWKLEKQNSKREERRKQRKLQQGESNVATRQSNDDRLHA